MTQAQNTMTGLATRGGATKKSLVMPPQLSPMPANSKSQFLLQSQQLGDTTLIKRIRKNCGLAGLKNSSNTLKRIKMSSERSPTSMLIGTVKTCGTDGDKPVLKPIHLYNKDGKRGWLRVLLLTLLTTHIKRLVSLHR